jgi:hypothetical protein
VSKPPAGPPFAGWPLKGGAQDVRAAGGQPPQPSWKTAEDPGVPAFRWAPEVGGCLVKPTGQFTDPAHGEIIPQGGVRVALGPRHYARLQYRHRSYTLDFTDSAWEQTQDTWQLLVGRHARNRPPGARVLTYLEGGLALTQWSESSSWSSGHDTELCFAVQGGAWLVPRGRFMLDVGVGVLFPTHWNGSSLSLLGAASLALRL